MYSLLFLVLTLNLFAINWTNPSVEDFEQLQSNLKNSQEKYLDCLATKKSGAGFWPPRRDNYKNFTFVRDGQYDKDVNIMSFGDNPKKVAVCSYWSFNWRRKGKGLDYFLAQRIRQLKAVHYDGDFIYQVGGFPNISAGDLKLYDVPYSFKLAMIRKIKSLGYKKVLWLDGIINARRNFDKYWDQLETTPALLMTSPWKMKDFCHEHVKYYTNLTEKELNEVILYDSGIMGLNLEDPRIIKSLSDWYDFALIKHPFFSSFPEQLPLCIALFRNKVPIKGRVWRNFFKFNYRTIK
ncbi:MAG: hypothetical protein S4CHLAM20_13310 [Chlamydiia bacterium]|nr:hypothetical protein [Chlamydiia bacterium]